MTCQILHVHKSVSDETLKEFAQGHNATGQIWGSSGPGKGSCHCRALPSRRQSPRAKLPVPVSFPNINLPPPVSWESHHPLLLPRPGSQYRNAQGSAVCLVIWEGDHSCTPTPLRSAAVTFRAAATPLSVQGSSHGPVCRVSLAPGEPTRE